MSIFLNSQPSLNKLYPDNSLIHTYNKKVFADYDTAVELLMYKVLCPGEIGFAYYNDQNSDYGINAIFAVGPLVQGGGNIIFKNALELNQIFNKLNDTITNINVSINKIKDDLFLSLCDVSTRLDSALSDTLDLITGPMNVYQQQLNGIYQKLYDIKITVDNKAEQSDLDNLEKYHNEAVIGINKKIDDNFDTLLSHILNQKQEILEYIQEAIRSSVSSSDDKSDLLIGEAKTELLKAFKTIQNDYYSLYNEVKKSINELEEKHNNDINLLHTNVNNLTNNVNKIEYDLSDLTYNTDSHYVKLLEKIETLEHRFIHHLAECPDNFNKDLIN